MHWIFFALGAPIGFSVVNHFDKYLLRRYFPDTGSHILIIFSSLIGLLVAPVFFLINPNAIFLPWPDRLALLASGALFILACYPYLAALEKDDTSLVVALFQLLPLFTYALGWLFLGETLTAAQLLAAGLIIVGAMGMSLDTKELRWTVKWSILGLMALSSFLFSLDSVLFKVGAVAEDFWVSTGWQYAGFVIPGLAILTFAKRQRRIFFSLFRVKGLKIMSLNVINELVNLFAKISINFASLLAPVALVWVINGFQPFFSFLIGFGLTLFLPALAKEDISKTTVIRKLLCMAVMVVGVFLLEG